MPTLLGGLRVGKQQQVFMHAYFVCLYLPLSRTCDFFKFNMSLHWTAAYQLLSDKAVMMERASNRHAVVIKAYFFTSRLPKVDPPYPATYSK